MAGWRKAGLVQALAVSLWLSTSAAFADVLVTTGGSRHRGTVSREGGTYVVLKPDGGKIVFPAAMVREVIRETATSRPAAAGASPASGSETVPSSPTSAPATRPAVVLKGKRILLVGGFRFDEKAHLAVARTWAEDALRRIAAVPVRDFSQSPQLVVLGEPVSRPGEPAANADVASIAAYKRELEGWKESPRQIAEARKQAAARSVEILPYDEFMVALREAVLRLKVPSHTQPVPASEANARLRRPVPTVSFQDTKLVDTLDYLQALTGVSIYVDWKSLEAGDIRQDTKVSLELKDVAAETVLKMVLKSVGKGDAKYSPDWASLVVVSTPDALKRLLAGGPKEWTGTRRPTAEEQAVIRKLSSPIQSAKFRDVKVEDLVAFVRDVSGLSIWVDWRRLSDIGLDRTTLITMNLAHVPIGRVLELAVAGHGAKVTVRGKMVQVVPAEH